MTDSEIIITYKAGKPSMGVWLGQPFKFKYSVCKHGGTWVGCIERHTQILHDAGNMIAVFNEVDTTPQLFTSPKKTGTVVCHPKLTHPVDPPSL
jgi:hypothetical protein